MKMPTRHSTLTIIVLTTLSGLTPHFSARADTLHLADGTVLENVFVRDDLQQFVVWDNLESIGRKPSRIVLSIRLLIRRRP
jgi:hypothetical protein